MDEWLAKRKQQFSNPPAIGQQTNQGLTFTKPTTTFEPRAFTKIPTQSSSKDTGELIIKKSATDLSNKEMRLTDLQNRGIGSNISFTANTQPGLSTQLSHQDSSKVEHAIHVTRQDEIMKQPLQGDSQPQDQDDGLDEIFIDVRGNLHHSGDQK